LLQHRITPNSLTIMKLGKIPCVESYLLRLYSVTHCNRVTYAMAILRFYGFFDEMKCHWICDYKNTGRENLPRWNTYARFSMNFPITDSALQFPPAFMYGSFLMNPLYETIS